MATNEATDVPEEIWLSDNNIGLILAVSSSIFIGASFIIKKKGLRLAGSGQGALRAGAGGYSYLLQPMWWAGMLTMILGEVCNFAAYAFAPAILVTPLGALSIIVSAVLADMLLKEKLHFLGVLGCALCIVGSTVIVIHAPEEQPIDSVVQLFAMAMAPAFTMYTVAVVGTALVLIFWTAPKYGNTQVLVYVGICSLIGSLSVMSCKALGIAIKLTFEGGTNQLLTKETLFFAVVVAACVVTQMNYLNKALDIFNTAIVSPIYYVLFTTLTICASAVMFREADAQSFPQMLSQGCGFVVIMAGTFLLHISKDLLDVAASVASAARDAPTLTEQEALAQGLSSLYNATLNAASGRTPSKRAAAAATPLPA
mmetsp:Transcript_801/g.2956  ORF Transcript_801/g.2956 Transcript_801/m.2956 type:complete len:369 (+) Transcript_801:201-1307(+)